MGIASAITQGVTGSMSVGLGIQDSIRGSRQAGEAKRALDNYKRQTFTNVAGGLAPSTLGSDFQRQEQARLASGQIAALQGSGTRGLIGGLGRVEVGNQRVMQETGADLDMQQKQIDQLYAQDQAAIRNMQERREYSDIAALSSQYQQGIERARQGKSNIIKGVGQVGNSFSGGLGGGGGAGMMGGGAAGDGAG